MFPLTADIHPNGVGTSDLVINHLVILKEKKSRNIFYLYLAINKYDCVRKLFAITSNAISHPDLVEQDGLLE